MRGTLFSYYFELGHELCYQEAYAISVRRIEATYSAFLMLASAGGIVTLAIWDTFPFVWAAIALLAQVLQVIKPLMPFSKQKTALRYIRQDTQALFDEVALFWDSIGKYAETPERNAMIADKLKEFKSMQRSTLDRFGADIEFPKKARIQRKATKENEKHFWFQYHIKPEGVTK